jgi:hypothetical protein
VDVAGKGVAVAKRLLRSALDAIFNTLEDIVDAYRMTKPGE